MIGTGLYRWLGGALVVALYLLGAVLDGPSETDSLQASADAGADAIAQAQQVAQRGDEP